jgi:hypothetical protein
VADELIEQEAVAPREPREAVAVSGAEVLEVVREATMEGRDARRGDEDLAPVEAQAVAVEPGAAQADMQAILPVLAVHPARPLVGGQALGH